MDVFLSVVSYHRLSAGQLSYKSFGPDGGTIGRSTDADWHLPDPSRILSSRHAEIAYECGAFVIRDLSTNGVYVNHADKAIGKGLSHRLMSGDILTLGDYEIAVSYEADESHIEPVAQVSAPISEGLMWLPDDINPRPPSSSEMLGGEDGTAAFMAGSPLTDHMAAPLTAIPREWRWQEQAPATPSALTGDDGRSSIGDEKACMAAFLEGMKLDISQLPEYQNPDWWRSVGGGLKEALDGLLQLMRTRSAHRAAMHVQHTTFQCQDNNPFKFSPDSAGLFYNLFTPRGAGFMPPLRATKETFSDLARHELALMAAITGLVNGLLAELSPEQCRRGVDKQWLHSRHQAWWKQFTDRHELARAELSSLAAILSYSPFLKAYEQAISSAGETAP